MEIHHFFQFFIFYGIGPTRKCKSILEDGENRNEKLLFFKYFCSTLTAQGSTLDVRI